MPVFGDQKGNVVAAETDGWVRMLKWEELTEKTLFSAIMDTMHNIRYQIYNMDAWAFIISVVILLLSLFFLILKYFYKCLKRRLFKIKTE
ncbi:hypothetical protein Anas_08213 [Armadillidium nasatum]|uniref:Glucuronosyltransferase n=1 Tax=Armadillidium nasatum TaxID=96803 RepID=A0A5N5TH64_9CRUS|nr:hypothetical protein Anas_08213 [Armadillidium nasatum]